MEKNEFLEKNKIKMHSSVVVGTKGQIVIPKSVRELMKINSGDNLMIITKGEKFLGIIKNEDLEFFNDYLTQHLKSNKCGNFDI